MFLLYSCNSSSYQTDFDFVFLFFFHIASPPSYAFSTHKVCIFAYEEHNKAVLLFSFFYLFLQIFMSYLCAFKVCQLFQISHQYLQPNPQCDIKDWNIISNFLVCFCLFFCSYFYILVCSANFCLYKLWLVSIKFFCNNTNCHKSKWTYGKVRLKYYPLGWLFSDFSKSKKFSILLCDCIWSVLC